jgi:xanthine permease XanP
LQTIAFTTQPFKIAPLLKLRTSTMSVNTAESQQPASAASPKSELIYRLEDRPPLPQTLFAACQHLLAMFVAVITPALLICQALGLPAQDTQHIISMSLFASGVASILQIKT